MPQVFVDSQRNREAWRGRVDQRFAAGSEAACASAAFASTWTAWTLAGQSQRPRWPARLGALEQAGSAQQKTLVVKQALDGPGGPALGVRGRACLLHTASGVEQRGLSAEAAGSTARSAWWSWCTSALQGKAAAACVVHAGRRPQRSIGQQLSRLRELQHEQSTSIFESDPADAAPGCGQHPSRPRATPPVRTGGEREVAAVLLWHCTGAGDVWAAGAHEMLRRSTWGGQTRMKTTRKLSGSRWPGDAPTAAAGRPLPERDRRLCARPAGIPRPQAHRALGPVCPSGVEVAAARSLAVRGRRLALVSTVGRPGLAGRDGRRRVTSGVRVEEAPARRSKRCCRGAADWARVGAGGRSSL
ncbi:hypothetical protein B0J12DRAFT_756051 [Macrophomina phaseolina]|uniref:Uncharacterized protein n=1 Tax=Macrophomina phaseolina TaxID=35725 RepID=A0ABQ8G8Q3_9PEZI|nr:hypothetical protein B0J12DRAFT_756051 [Macrophomina phaseolina]